MRKRPGRNREPIEVREQVYFEPPYFKVYNHIQERYARRLGFNAWGIYTTLKQFANYQTGQCTVSLERMAKTWGVTMRTVQRGVRKLRDFGLIRVKKNQASSTYTILKIRDTGTRSRHDKNVASDTSQMSLQTRQQSRIEHSLFNTPSLTTGAPVDTSSKRGNSIAMKRFQNFEVEIEKLLQEGKRLMEQYGGTKGSRHPRVLEIADQVQELKRQQKILGVRLGVYE